MSIGQYVMLLAGIAFMVMTATKSTTGEFIVLNGLGAVLLWFAFH